MLNNGGGFGGNVVVNSEAVPGFLSLQGPWL